MGQQFSGDVEVLAARTGDVIHMTGENQLPQVVL